MTVPPSQHAPLTAESSTHAPLVVIVMGVAGAGKTTLGRNLATALGWQFVDADDFHSAANLDKMGQGVPLDDRDRQPWLMALKTAIAGWIAQATPVVLACSALKARYRDHLGGSHPQVRWVYLYGDRALIRDRLASRQHHFMTPALLDSQFAALEAPTDAIAVDVAHPPAVIVQMILASLQLEGRGSP